MRSRRLFSHAVMGLAIASLAGLTVVAFEAQQQATAPPAVRTAAAPPVKAATQTPNPVSAHATTAPAADKNAVFKRYCVTCHNDRAKAGGLSLASFDAAGAAEHAEVTEKIVRKLRAGMMPPAGARRPEPSVLSDLAAALETRVDHAAALNPNPGRRPFQRLNRAEYTAAVRDLLDLDVDVDAYLPPDTISDGFDNVADAQGFSPTVLEGYLRAASAISALAVGDAKAAPTEANYKVPRTANQMRQVEGAPFGTRGGICGDAHLPGRRRVHVPHDAALDPDRTALRQQLPGRADRGLHQRGARGAHRHQHAHERVGSERDEPGHAEDLRQGRPATRRRRVHLAVRRPG